jgi:hypothetical protein
MAISPINDGKMSLGAGIGLGCDISRKSFCPLCFDISKESGVGSSGVTLFRKMFILNTIFPYPGTPPSISGRHLPNAEI